MKRELFLSVGMAAVLLAVALISTGCGTFLGPQFTYQGRLTDANGNPLSGTYTLTLQIYDDDTGGTSLYTTTDVMTVTDGLFDTVIGPTTVIAGLGPEDLAQPLWLEVEVSDGSIAETLEPRQRLYGAPYAFTLMPGAYISETMSESLHGAGGATAILNVVNSQSGNALPALRAVGDKGLMLTGASSVDGTGDGESGVIYGSQGAGDDGDLAIYSNDEVAIYLDEDGGSGSNFRIVSGDTDTLACMITESGDLNCNGTKSSVVQIDEVQRRFYAMESPEVWFEDFGTASLEEGEKSIEVDPQFAQTVNMDEDYHVFVTPLGNCNGLYVAEKTATSFTVRELSGGTSDASFDYRIVAKRSGYENTRLEPMTLSDGD